jgi:hypothetical protein
MEEKKLSDIPQHKPVIIYSEPPVDELEALRESLDALDNCIDRKWKEYNEKETLMRKMSDEIDLLRDSRKRLALAITIIEKSRVARALENPE